MRRTSRPTILLCCLILLAMAVGPAPAQASTSARYVILFQGDGMAARHIEAGGYYVCGYSPCLSFESFPNQTTMTHNNASGGVTDSAASATAMATGVKVSNGVISVRLPGDGSELRSLLEAHRDSGKSTGLVTESYLTDASPAAHGAHESSRNNGSAIFLDFVNQSRPNVLLGGGGNGFSSASASNAGYTVVTDLAGLQAVDTEAVAYLAGGFGSGLIPPAGYPGRSATLPTLPEMTAEALAILDNDPDGFYLFLEHEGIDEYSHANDATNLVRSMAEFSSAVQVAIDWVNDPATPADWTNTLFVVVGDHETGGITNVVNNGAGVTPSITWTTTGHTATPVRVLAQGAGADQITGAQIDNTAVFGLLSPQSAPAPSVHIGDLDGVASGAKKSWTATVTITAHDATEAPLAGVLVSGNWTGGATGAASCTTGSTGFCEVRKTNLKPSVSSVSFTVTAASKSGYSYASGANHDVDGGTNGTTVIVAK